MPARHFLGRLIVWIVLIGLSPALGVSMAEGAEPKFHPASGFDPVIGHYLVTLDSSVADAGSTAEALARSYGGQLELYASADVRTFAITMLAPRARTLSADPRVREVVEMAQPDSRETPPVAPRQASLTSPHLVPHQLSTSGTYTYDGSGNIKGIGADSFFYDIEGRLVDATVQSNQQTYTYDIYGNRLSATRANGAIGCLGNTTCEAPVTMSETPSTTNHLAGVTYDEAGNVTQGYDATYAYDGTGMVTRAAVGTDIRNFVYTADDERIAVRQGMSWTWSVRDQGGKVLREFTSLESTPFALSAHVWSKDYVWRDGQLLASTSIPAGYSSPVTYHYHLNHLGTPRMITRDNGFVVSNHNYYPFGSEMDVASPESPAEAMKFTGHERDTFAGSNHSVDYMHARYYNANLGRFLSVDPGPVDPERPQSWNRYAYVGNSPISFSDATGRERGRYGPPPKLAPGAAREAAHKIDQFLTRVGQVGLDAVFVVGVIESVVETGDGDLIQPAAEKLESDVNVMVEEAETEGPVVFRGGSGIVARDSEIKVVNGEVQPSRGPSVNTDPAKVEGHGEPHKIESLPQGLTLRQTGKDAGHYEIVPTAPVSKTIFQQLLDQIIRLPL